MKKITVATAERIGFGKTPPKRKGQCCNYLINTTFPCMVLKVLSSVVKLQVKTYDPCGCSILLIFPLSIIGSFIYVASMESIKAERMIKQKNGILRIGTSGIVVPGAKQSFPIEFQHKSRLNFYSSLFNTLEINSSFYKVPLSSTFEKWAQDVPENFRFTIKLWREITHVKKLNVDFGNITRFLQAADQTGNKKGCILVQFPGKITLEYYNEVEQIFLRLQENDPHNKWRKAIEFRSPTWYVSETYELLEEFGASIVLHDIPKSKNSEINKPAQFVYLRFHGPKGDYRGSYSDDFLREQSEQIKGWLSDGKDVYAYFNNTIGSAYENAMTLKGMSGL